MEIVPSPRSKAPWLADPQTSFAMTDEQTLTSKAEADTGQTGESLDAAYCSETHQDDKRANVQKSPVKTD
eukprot:CAMPEP_0185569362 /NCGR_PEP_ID=MMETSP0434-20130131/2008_1 /TAXON_ID=626734 ORGANISM="Favella taraikaensis, Strain Fe Narragansett Bay" /NCGR_SAMPLE_ID=MMETSP0434 /ASSEMBLY_ACC=CAM_ASM_000379 /LENGTH=69 /DNA_ID=CAMNT_0028184125 /DNA_START=804 /DNA_END=1013 /DNA_ORIENTATION=-